MIQRAYHTQSMQIAFSEYFGTYTITIAEARKTTPSETAGTLLQSTRMQRKYNLFYRLCDVRYLIIVDESRANSM